MAIWIVLLCLFRNNVFGQTFATNDNVPEVFQESGITPQHVREPPSEYLHVEFPSGYNAQLGNELTPSEVDEIPAVTWSLYDESSEYYYTLGFIDCDPLGRRMNGTLEGRQWLVVNIPSGGNITAGDTITEFQPSTPRMGTGQHRYAIVLYRQQGVVDVDERPMPDAANRYSSTLNTFSENYNLTAVAGNYYLSQFDGNEFRNAMGTMFPWGTALTPTTSN